MRTHNRGFTLIEVMVVLSILAIIAVLAYNFFGNTVKEAKLKQAATQTYKDMRVLNDAWDEYIRLNGAEFAYNPENTFADTVDAGIIKALPHPPSAAAGTGGLQPDYYVYDAWDNFAGTATQDRVIEMYNVNDAFCAQFNDLYTSLGSTVWDYQGQGNTYPAGEMAFCLKWQTTDVDGAEVMWILEAK